MRDAAGEITDGLHLLRLAQSLAEALLAFPQSAVGGNAAAIGAPGQVGAEDPKNETAGAEDGGDAAGRGARSGPDMIGEPAFGGGEIAAQRVDLVDDTRALGLRRRAPRAKLFASVDERDEAL